MTPATSVATGDVASKVAGKRLALLGVGVLVVMWVAYLAALGWHNFSSHSDSSNAVLAGRDLVQGNLLLRGWNLPQASYWTIDLPIYGLLSLLVGPNAGVVHLGPALIGIGLVTVGAVIARSGTPGPAGLVSVAIVVLVLGLPHPFLTYILYQGPWHVGTPLWCLGAFLLLSNGRPAPAVAGLGLLTLAMLGDALALAIGVMPLLAAGLVQAARQRNWRVAGRPAAAAVCSVTAAVVVRFGLDRVGGFSSVSQPLRPLEDWPGNLRLMSDLLARLVGASPDSGLSGGYRALHFVGALLIVLGLVATALVILQRLVRPEPPGDRPAPFDIDAALLFGFLGGVLTAVAITPPGSGIAGARYLPGPLAYAAILAGRRVREVVSALPLRATAAVVPLVALLALGYLAASASGLKGPKAVEPEGELAAWLAERGLLNGYGDYWTASDLVVNSGGRVTVRPVASRDGRLHGYWYYAKRSWFAPGGQRERPPNFIAFPADARHGVGEQDITATFGEPHEYLRFGGYVVLVYGRDLQPELGAPLRP